jgi:hypothetical protein
MPRDARAKVLADYRAGDVQIVCNAMLLTEGFDAPATSCIALARPTGSRSLMAQMIGRGTRIAEGKEACLVIDFVPERTARLRLAAPADVLAGTELSDELAERVAQMSLEGERDLEAMIAEARASLQVEKAASAAAARAVITEEYMRRRQYIKSVGVAYAAHVMPIGELLAEVCPRTPGEPRATAPQVEALRRCGFEIDEGLTAREARTLFRVREVRRERGLCTVKQARVLKRFGLRDDVSVELATEALTAIASNGWRPPSRLYEDARFRVEAAA